MTYTEIKKANKDYRVILTLGSDCIYFTYCFNNISQTYMGLQCNSFIDSIRGLLRTLPSFFEDLSEHDYRKDFEKMGFKKVEPTESEIRIWGN